MQVGSPWIIATGNLIPAKHLAKDLLSHSLHHFLFLSSLHQNLADSRGTPPRVPGKGPPQ